MAIISENITKSSTKNWKISDFLEVYIIYLNYVDMGSSDHISSEDITLKCKQSCLMLEIYKRYRCFFA